MTLGNASLIAFVGAEDLARARAFYAGVLGLNVTGESPFALDVDVAGTMLRIIRVEACRPAPYTVLGWAVADIAASVGDLAAKGVRFERYPGMTQDGLGIWAAPSGARVAWFKDPDGNTLSLTEFPGD